MEELIQTMSIRDARDTFADVVDRASQDEFTIITRRGKEIAAVVPVEMVRGWIEHERAWLRKIIEERRDEPTYTLEEIAQDLLGDRAA